MAQRKSNPDWEQRRYEIAKEIFVKQFSGFCVIVEDNRMITHANEKVITPTMRLCIEYADIFINELRKED